MDVDRLTKLHSVSNYFLPRYTRFYRDFHGLVFCLSFRHPGPFPFDSFGSEVCPLQRCQLRALDHTRAEQNSPSDSSPKMAQPATHGGVSGELESPSQRQTPMQDPTTEPSSVTADSSPSQSPYRSHIEQIRSVIFHTDTQSSEDTQSI